MPPVISIVTPSYNQGRFLRQTIESILGQDYPHLELWVMDGGSTDESLDVMRSFEGDKRFHWVSEKDKGQSDAITKGLARCTGEIFNWVNSDDYLEPGALKAVADAFEEKKADIICGVTRKFEDLTGETTGYMQMEIKGNAEDTILIGRVCQQGTFWKTEIFRELGGVREDLDCAMDWHLWVKYLVKHGQVRAHKIDKLLAHFRQHPESKTGRAASQFKQEINAIYLDLFTFLGAPDYLREYLRSLTGLNLPPTPWKPGEHIKAKRLFAKYCEKIVKLYYHDQAYERASVWLKRSLDCNFRITPFVLRFGTKIFWKKNIMKEGFKF
ncbi:MAG: glycosyltransferase family 2 protein [Candidatus Methylacidiphilales bacterium]|nr:glycosyltransferase family 2 protein [Candidatus Methylacidiphilales bacterium]